MASASYRAANHQTGSHQEGPGESLRAGLRAATMAAHDLLDHAMQAASGWQTLEDYARFLELQHAARAPLERRPICTQCCGLTRPSCSAS